MTTTTPHRNNRKPKIVVGATDHERLSALAASIQDRMPELADELQAEMERAKVVAERQVPANVVRMGSFVSFESDAAPTRRVQLVFPGEADIAAGRVSVLTPIGTALIGLSPGQSIAWTARDGRQHRLTVLNVEQAVPEAVAPKEAG
ncbi:nucleoside diphosphate kinase regulator [Bosea sp. BK604]|uniref:nucleoside diphosphate kinase regulator n=1 Tax=Bosea sp. BK604 TaxID=2512180 RepID=UPI001042BAF8|nr:nucleoside diphosphate kinase regulator [Bosea sp. BK604]TCR67251.1 regulator of nucleoside diphosphate kinase [Bosea sp. BK604]